MYFYGHAPNSVREGIYISDGPFRLYKCNFRLHKRVWDVAYVNGMNRLYKREVHLRLLKYLPLLKLEHWCY